MTTIEQSYAPWREIVLKLGILAFGLFVVGTNAFVIAGLLFATMLATASGTQTKSELHGYGQNEFVPWYVGAVM